MFRSLTACSGGCHASDVEKDELLSLRSVFTHRFLCKTIVSAKKRLFICTTKETNVYLAQHYQQFYKVIHNEFNIRYSKIFRNDKI